MYIVEKMIVLISGSINSGKSSVSKVLRGEIPQCAHVEVDVMHAFTNWMHLEESIPLHIKNAVSISENYLHYGLNVIVSYPLREEDYAFIVDRLTRLNISIYCFVLSPPLEIALSNRGHRDLSEWEYNRIKFHYSTGLSNPSFGIKIDNSQQTIEETAEYILSNIK